MARNNGIDRTSVRNLAVSDKAVGNTQQHNEREKDSYRNPDIIPQRTAWNVHFKKPTASYTDLFAQLEAAGTISTRGLKPDATHYCELVFDVNSAYFDNHGGYEFAKQFYADAYKAAVRVVGGEQYILSAVMHADEINRAITEALDREVYHYHLHVVYVPVVEKQILWSKRCKDKALVGTVKETVMQVSRSKKWASKPLLDDAGEPVLQKNGKPVLKKSYSILQDDFFNYMHNAGYTDVERGECGSTEEHLTVTQFKVQREQERLDSLTAQADQKAQSLAKTSQTLSKKEKELATVQKKAALTQNALIHAQDVASLGKKTLLGNYSLTEEEFSQLKSQAAHGFMVDMENRQLKQQLSAAQQDSIKWQTRYRNLRNEVQPYLDAMRHAPERVRNFFENLLSQKPERTASIPKDRHHEQNAEL
ncbi:plasmid recombination protein [Faecalibacterium prausnitzii]|uniref:plasmid recombination protein n=1 Tax=Faecalibacterium prausnitzii TaxID=853 RepID=UPI0012DEE799|nr:plasmid recombination protein [Faecalibacterium prausnitzii]